MDPRFPLWLCALLYPAGLVYRGAVEMRNYLYRRGALSTVGVDVPVISVGNLTVGGSGKTPFVAYLAGKLTEEGWKVAIASRGYGGAPEDAPRIVGEGAGARLSAREAGDEPVLLAQLLPSVVVVVGRDRTACAKLVRDRFGSNLILLDDGYQHRHLARRVDLLLTDAGEGFGNGKMLPCGPLREPLRELARCDAIVVTGLVDETREGVLKIREVLSRLRLSKPVFACERRPCGFIRLESDEALDLEALKGMRVVSFSGIARPWAFESDLGRLGVVQVDSVRFRDHHHLTPRDLSRLEESVRRNRPDLLVTTEKDRARLAGIRLPAPACALRIRMFPENESEMMSLLAARIASSSSLPAGS